MLVTNAVSVTLGFIPFAGDVFVALFKANSRNAALLEEFLRIRGEEVRDNLVAFIQYRRELGL